MIPLALSVLLVLSPAAMATAAPATAAPATVADRHAVDRAPITASVSTAVSDDPAARLIEAARAAWQSGDLEAARSHFLQAIRLQRAEGILSVVASYGAAEVLTQQAHYREAAEVLDQLAADANLLGDAETEARVLLDVVAVKMKGERRATARAEATRLLQLVDDERLSGETRRLIRARIG